MILLDTHIWVWWVSQDPRLDSVRHAILRQNEAAGLGVSIICCWEVAKLVENSRLQLDRPAEEWIARALAHPGIRLLDLTPRIVVESTQLPGSFHRDPADQIIVATARVHDCPLLTIDARILNYPYVRTLP
ncbi:MAG: type II toxin-antitoxin system VapC family toxin [Acidobacteria bacterium]|nr:type II toxin-antitoxin system VapC family toxin [Acidobacteriota bacterium]